MKHYYNTPYSRGHVGLVTLLVTITAIVLVMVAYFGSLADKDAATGQTKIERDMQAIDDAKAAKDLIELRNQVEIGE